MQITEKELIEIINEEIKDLIESGDIDEGILDRVKASASGGLSSIGSKLAGAVGATGASADMAANAKLKQAASIMNSYAQHMLKLRQKLEKDVNKLGLGQVQDIVKVTNAIEQSRALTQQTADLAPKSEKFRQAVQAAVAQQTGGQPATAEPAASEPAVSEPAAEPADEPAATPAAATGAKSAKTAVKPSKSAKPAAKPKRQLSQDPRNVKRRERRAAKKAAAQKERERKDRRNAQARARRAKKKASAAALSKVPSRAASRQNESEVKKGETLNEQLQEISRRWGFDK